ncbi:hypothetical protein GCM10009850_122150 [Nonomuraea monospora]|uniref:Uncharacterized protein n=1 Tax=Nonomuraea monospora TaxID=568818 RepID=A0ABP5Q325_9ACTN
MDSHGSAPAMGAPTGAIPQSRSADGDVTRRRQAVTPIPQVAGVPFYEWTVWSTETQGSCGVTSLWSRATVHLVTALLNSPAGAVGRIRPARIDRDRPLDYAPTAPIIQACRLSHGAVRLWGGA